MSTQSAKARLYFILARDAPTGVIFRRGPSKRVQIIKWNTEQDQFELGQWFYGRIYERRSDLSPDGTKMIYFAQKINAKTLNDPEYTYTWTAVSKPPCLTAIALWPKGDSWHGGGLFLKNDTVWLNHLPNVAEPHRDHKPPPDINIIPNPEASGEDEPVLWRRLERDGWILRQEWEGQQISYGYSTTKPEIWSKAHPFEAMTLYMDLSWKNFEKHYKFMVECADGQRVPVDIAECADWDKHGRLVYAGEGKVFAASVDKGCLVDSRELADLNDLMPKSLPAPEWAKVW